MGAKERGIVEDFENQVLEIINENNNLKRECLQKSAEIEVLQRELDKTRSQLVELNRDYDRLKVARVYGWSEQSKRDATNRISCMVRDIDKCLELLTK